MSLSANMNTIERAFQLARGGACHSVADIRTQLASESYDGVHGHLTGVSIQRQPRAVLAARGIAANSGADDDIDE